MSDQVICRVSDFLGARGDCHWQSSDVTWNCGVDLVGTDPDAYRNALSKATERIEAKCGVNLQEGQWFQAMIRATGREIDGPGGTLGEAQLPCSKQTSFVTMWLDGGESKWDQPKLEDVSLHEMLHTLGAPHTDDSNDIMYPSYDPSRRREIGPKTVAFLQKWYGSPKVSPVPKPGNGSGIMEFVLKVLKFLHDNPWIVDFIKKLLDKAGPTGQVSLEDVETELQTLKQEQG